jgi:hypothetical protein
MPQTVAGFPYWEVSFDEQGHLAQAQEADTVVAELPGQGLTDLFIFSHGWQNDRQMARDLYRGYFQLMRDLLDLPTVHPRRAATPGTLGVIWPSKRWADEPPPQLSGGGAVSLGRPAITRDADLVRDLKTTFTAPGQQQTLDEMADLLQNRPRDMQSVQRFHDLMGALVGAARDADPAPEDNGEAAGLLQDTPEHVFTRFSSVARRRHGGGAGLGDVFSRMWDGAKEALRQLTYWEMKHRAGLVGQEGLGPFLGRLAATQPSLRVHLLGHSFGARLVSFSLAGLPDGLTGQASPIKSVTLLQGAFSHFAFAAPLPQDQARGGALAGMAARVDGPLLVTHSVNDLAVGRFYPLASMAGRDDASAADDLLFRWGAMGHDGAQAVQAADVPLGPVGQAYPFATGAFLNLDGDQVIKKMEPVSGAHGDIFHSEIAWTTLAAAGML